MNEDHDPIEAAATGLVDTIRKVEEADLSRDEETALIREAFIDAFRGVVDHAVDIALQKARTQHRRW